MHTTLTIPGLPTRLATDAWWLSTPLNGAPPEVEVAEPKGRLPRGVAILALTALADLLFWGQEPGLSLALFAGAVFALAVLRGGLRHWQRPAMLLAVAALPVVDLVQPLSVAFLCGGLAVALIWAQHATAPWDAVAFAAARFLGRLPWEWIVRLNPARPVAALGQIGPMQTHLRNWAFPLGGGLVILGLLMEANPVLAELLTLDLDLWEAAQRGVFWAGTALLVTPFLARHPVPGSRAPQSVTAPGLGLTEGSVLRALVLFNLLIGLQTATDLFILVGGATLPRGMTLAEFAHRGAYPLLATAILAGAFALKARPFLDGHRAIRPLLLLWLTQNVVLCGAAALRLDLYIESFSLTYLRLYALIWMALVAVGLALVFVQVLRGRENGWLVRRAAGLGIATLYACSFVNFAQVIAAQNVQRADPDQAYLCALGPLAVGPIVESGIGRVEGLTVHLETCSIPLPRAKGWREWGFRSWAVHRYLQRVETAETAG